MGRPRGQAAAGGRQRRPPQRRGAGCGAGAHAHSLAVWAATSKGLGGANLVDGKNLSCNLYPDFLASFSSLSPWESQGVLEMEKGGKCEGL